MRVAEWNRARSDFNHGWLKNRLIVALFRAERILSGAVVDEGGLCNLEVLLEEWPERSRDASELINSYSRIPNLVHGEHGDDEVIFLQAVALERWRQIEKPEEKVKGSTEALGDLDEEIRGCSRLTIESVEILRRKAQILASAISELSGLNLPGTS